jgi:arabinofuranosyltransferase
MLSAMTGTSSVRILMAVAVVAFVLECVLLFGYTMDDAFISFRYARNVARGQGLVYNPGRPPVEGYSNFLWTVLFVPVIKWGWNPELVAKLLGIACGLGVLGITFLLSRRLAPASRFQVLAPVLVATSPLMAMQAITGLETHLFGLFFLAGTWLTLREWETRSRFPLSALAFLGCALTRPEGAFLFGVSLLAATVLVRSAKDEARQPRPALGWFVLSMFLFGAIYGLYTVWRLSYFGALIPNTFYAKTAGVQQVTEGWEYLRDFSVSHGGFFIYVMVLVALVFRWGDAGIRYLALLGSVFIGMVVYEGGDWMPLYRLFVPVLPILFLFFQEGVRVLYKVSQDWLKRHGGGNAGRVLAAALVTAGLVFSLALLPGKAREAMNRQDLYEKAHRRYAKWLAANTPPGDSIALSDIGQFGYYSDLPVIDLVGLTSPEIARAEGLLHEKKVDPSLVLSQRPAHVVLVCYRDDDQWKNRGFPAETALLGSEEFKRQYLLRELIYYTDNYSYWLFTRTDLKGLGSTHPSQN